MQVWDFVFFVHKNRRKLDNTFFIDNNIARQMWNTPLGICTQKMVVDESKKQDSQNDLTHSSYGRYGDKGVLVNMVHKRCFGVEEWRTTSGGQLLS